MSRPRKSSEEKQSEVIAVKMTPSEARELFSISPGTPRATISRTIIKEYLKQRCPFCGGIETVTMDNGISVCFSCMLLVNIVFHTTTKGDK